MGVSTSHLTSQEIVELQASTHFSGKEIEDLYTRFTRLDRSHNGYLTSSDLHLIPEFSMNPLCSRLISSFSSDHISFTQFAQRLSTLHPRADTAEKMEFVFNCLDIDSDGVINDKDLFLVLKSLVGNNLSEDLLQAIVKKTLDQASEGGGGLRREGLEKAIGKELIDQMTISFSQDDDLYKE